VATGGSDGHAGTSLATAFLTIGHAVSFATSGDTIIVGAGTFAEQLTITKALTLEGAGTSTIIAPTSMTSTTSGLISPPDFYHLVSQRF